MRRIAFLALLILLAAPACMYPPRVAPFPDGPTVTRGNGPSPGTTPQSNQPTQCVEVARSRCDSARCPGYKFDYVSIQCTGEGVKSYCRANSGCKAEETK